MQHLTFGVAPSPYLATQMLKQLEEHRLQEYHWIAHIVEKSFYADDCLTGTSTVQEVKGK